MTDQDPPQTAPYVLLPGEGETICSSTVRLIYKADAELTGGYFSLLEGEISPPKHPEPLHRHHNEAEAYYVLEGEATVQIGDEEYHLTPGAFAYIPAMTPHTMKLDAPIRLLYLFAPAGFEEMTRIFVKGGLPSEPDDRASRIDQIREEFGWEIVAP